MISDYLKCFRCAIAMAIGTFIVVLQTSPTNAALIISIPHVSVTAGSAGHLDVLIHSNDGMGTFQNYYLQFTISGVAQTADPINFVASVLPAPQLFASAPDPDYIFLGDSAEAATPIGLDSVSDQPGSPVADDLITVIDLTESGSDRPLMGLDNYLLARLNFIAPLGATPGNIYDIKLDGLTSYFEDTNSARIDVGLGTLSSNVGSITISPAAVPEPSTFFIMAMVGAGLVGRKLRHRRTSPGETMRPDLAG